MVEEPVVALSAECIGFFEQVLSDFPAYRLDATIPSVGVLDLLSFNLRGKRGFSERDQRIVTWSAAYIAGIVHDCLAVLPERPRVAVRLIEGSKPDIIIEVKEKAKSKQFFMKASIARHLVETLQQPPSPFPVIADYARPLAPYENILNLFTCGLLSGMPSHGEGLWPQESVKKSADRLAAIGNYAAHSCAAYYKRRFPGEAIGANPNLYIQGAAFPPPGFNEPFPYARLASGAAKHLKNTDSLSDKDIERISLNWLQAADDVLCPLGFILAAAVSQAPHDPRLLHAAESVGLNQAALRPGVLIAREALGVDVDWVEMLSLGSVAKCRELFEKDSAFGLHPFLRLSFDRARDPELRNVVNALAWSRPDSARAFMDQLPFQISSDLEVWTQAVYLDLSLGRLERAGAEIERIAAQDFEQHSLARFDYLELLGLFCIAKGEIGPAAEAFSKAFDIQLDNPKRLVSAGTNLAGCLMHLGQLEDAKRIIETATSTRDSSLAALVTKIDVYRSIGELDKAANITHALSKSIPGDRRVFDRVLATIGDKHTSDDS